MSRADHALDNYITSIQDYLSLLSEELPTDVERWDVSREAISQAAAQMRRNLERLRLVRKGLDENLLCIVPVNLVRLVEHVLIVLQPAATYKGITLNMEVQQRIQAISGDPQMCEEIFTILLDNAIKHNPPGTEVVAELTHKSGMALAVISDNGQGMSPELVEHIFDEGYRRGDDGSQRFNGMGLFIAHELTTIHGGTIVVQSEPGQGSRFEVALPFDRFA
jgi:signal transduction histidine kinase